MYAMQIQTGELRETDLPPGYGEWSDYAKFAVTFAPRDRDLCSVRRGAHPRDAPLPLETGRHHRPGHRVVDRRHR